MMKKSMCILMAALLLIGTLASCGTPTEPSSETTTQSPTSTDTVEVETRETLDVPDTRYDGAELVFLTRGGTSGWSTREIFTESLTSASDNISTAVYERNDRILQDYGVTISELREETGLHSTTVSKEISASTGDFQAIISDTSCQAGMASNGYLWDLNSDMVEYMDFTKPWWDSNMAEGLSIHDKLYFATGDLLTSDNDATFIITFNKKLATDYGIPNLYDLVENGEWTIEKFIELEQMVISDKNGDGMLTYDTDVCGLAYTGIAPLCFLIGSDITMCNKDDEDHPIYQLNVERTQNVSDLGELIFSKEHTVNLDAAVSSSGKPIEEVGNIAFGEDHALFYTECMQTVSHLRSFDVDFGILPYPKYNKAQTNYCSFMHMTASFVSIPRSVNEDDIVMVDAMIEAMSYHAVDTLTEQYYEINLKTKTAKDEESGPMIDKILSGRVCEMSYYYSWGSNAFENLASCLLPGTGREVASQSQRFQRSVNSSIDKLIETLDKLED